MTIHDDLREVMGLLAAMPSQELTVYDANEGDGWPPRPLWSLKNAAYDAGAEDDVVQLSLNFGHKNDADTLAACFNFLRQHGPALLAAAKYEEANPLGGPATMLEAAARRIRAGEDFHEVLADYGLLARQEGEDRLRDLHHAIRLIYGCVPNLPIDESTMDAATDALHNFCLMIGIHEVDVDWPIDEAARSGGGG